MKLIERAIDIGVPVFAIAFSVALISIVFMHAVTKAEDIKVVGKVLDVPHSSYTGFEFEIIGKASKNKTAQQNYDDAVNGTWCGGVLPKPGDHIEWVVDDVTHSSPTEVKVTGCWEAK